MVEHEKIQLLYVYDGFLILYDPIYFKIFFKNILHAIHVRKFDKKNRLDYIEVIVHSHFPSVFPSVNWSM